MYRHTIKAPSHIQDNDLDAYYNSEITKLVSHADSSRPRFERLVKLDYVDARTTVVYFEPPTKKYNYAKEFPAPQSKQPVDGGDTKPLQGVAGGSKKVARKG